MISEVGSQIYLPLREVSLVPGGQNPISLEYQIHPPTIDTLVLNWNGYGMFYMIPSESSCPGVLESINKSLLPITYGSGKK